MTHRLLSRAILLLSVLVAAPAALSQNVSGVVTDGATPLVGVNVLVEGTFVGDVTNEDGRFALGVDFSGGVETLVFSYIGFETRRIDVEGPTDNLQVMMEPDVLQSGDVVVSASRVPENVLEAPVTVERLNAAQLERLPQTEIISSLERLKGIDVSRSSMLISSLSTRGFNSAKSERLIQLVDGFDFVSPTLSLYVGNLTGVPEIDVESVEIVYGANSALYGANAFNGVVLFQTRDPFRDTGVSAWVRGGERGMFEFQGRWAQRVGDRFAYKVVGSYFEADDYISTNYATLSTIPGNYIGGQLRSSTDPRGADLVNRYGEVEVVTPTTCLQRTPPPERACVLTIGDLGFEGSVFTPGFTENDLVLGDYRAQAARINVEGSYLLTDEIKATLSGRYAIGNGIYQSSNRYAFDGIGGKSLGAVVEAESWTLRGLVNDADAGDTYDLGFLGSFMNRAPFQDPETGDMIMVPIDAGNPDAGLRPLIYAERYGQVYAGVFAQARAAGASVEEAYTAAASAVTGLYPTLEDPRFTVARDLTLANETPGQSPTFKSDGQIYNADGQYRFSLPAAVEAAVGANFRQYVISSEGTLYSDGPNSPLVNGATGERSSRDGITNYSYGGYLQLRRAFLDDALKLSAVGRLDAFKNFDARFSPRVTAVLSLGETRQHNVRASYAQAFREPAQLDQYISLDVGSLLLLGNIGTGYEGLAFTGGTVGDPISIDPLTLERMNSFEVGYKGLLGSLLADVSYYRSVYNDFIGTRRFFGRETGEAPNPVELVAPPASNDPGFANRTRLLQVWLNADQSVTSQGFQASLEYRLARAFVPTVNYAWSDIEDVEDLIVGFNTPEHKANVGVSGQLTNELAYSANVRWVDDYFYAMPFAEGMIESHTTVDAQVSYAFPQFGVKVLAGGTNLTDSDNLSAYGAAAMGRIIYLGVRYNQ
jgi:outer membrane receptor protein involved in Fe transport